MWHDCGPLRIAVDGDNPEAMRVVLAALDLYRGFQSPAERKVAILVVGNTARAVASGSYLTCARMLVDRSTSRCLATTRSGIGVERGNGDGPWMISVPRVTFDEPTIGDVEDLLSLILTEEWRAGGWEPMHAGCVVSPRGHGVLLCAASGGGKSTLTAALVRNGWHTLGDDKLLICRETGQAFSLCKSFNLDPRSARWFGELEAISTLPRYSAWTEKRRVFIERVWPGTLAWSARPTHVAKIVRDDSVESWWSKRLTSRQIFATMLDQIVVPNDRAVAREIVGTVSNVAAGMKGFELRVGSRAYETRTISDVLEVATA